MEPTARRICAPLRWLLAIAVVPASAACGDDGGMGSGTDGSGPGPTSAGTLDGTASGSVGVTGSTDPTSAGDTVDSTGDVPEPMQPRSPFIVVDQ